MPRRRHNPRRHPAHTRRFAGCSRWAPPSAKLTPTRRREERRAKPHPHLPPARTPPPPALPAQTPPFVGSQETSPLPGSASLPPSPSLASWHKGGAATPGVSGISVSLAAGLAGSGASKPTHSQGTPPHDALTFTGTATRQQPTTHRLGTPPPTASLPASSSLSNPLLHPTRPPTTTAATAAPHPSTIPHGPGRSSSAIVISEDEESEMPQEGGDTHEGCRPSAQPPPHSSSEYPEEVEEGDTGSALGPPRAAARARPPAAANQRPQQVSSQRSQVHGPSSDVGGSHSQIARTVVSAPVQQQQQQQQQQQLSQTADAALASSALEIGPGSAYVSSSQAAMSNSLGAPRRPPGPTSFAAANLTGRSSGAGAAAPPAVAAAGSANPFLKSSQGNPLGAPSSSQHAPAIGQGNSSIGLRRSDSIGSRAESGIHTAGQANASFQTSTLFQATNSLGARPARSVGGANGDSHAHTSSLGNNSLGSFPGARPGEGPGKSQHQQSQQSQQQRSGVNSVGGSDSFGGRNESLPMSRTHVSATFAGSETGPGAGVGDSSSQEMTSPQLSWEQENVLELVKAGTSVFFTGNAGTGKTFLLSRIITELHAKFGANFLTKVAVVASTGIAATHIQGTTINSALGIGAPSSYKDFGSMHKKENKMRIKGWEVLVIDEASMVSAEFFEKVEEMLREVRGNGQPAGGLQLIICGDFFQLPPVCKRMSPGTHIAPDAFINWGYAFQCPAWLRCGMEQVLLTKVFRQSDTTFVQILDDIRYGRDVAAALRKLTALCSRPLSFTDGIKPTRLFSRNKDVDDINAQELGSLPGHLMTLPALDERSIAEELQSSRLSSMDSAALINKLDRAEFWRDCLAHKEIGLKVGAQVMLIKNQEAAASSLVGPGRQLVNGSRGVIVAFVPKKQALETLNKLRVELGGSSRDAAGAGMSSIRRGPSGNKALDLVERQIADLTKWQGTQVPSVRFLNGIQMDVIPTLFRTSIAQTGECRRLQVPIKLAYAITIHKCQGLSLDRVQVSLRCMFEKGQAYVALSRARSLEGLQVLDWDMDCVKVDLSVRAFYAALQAGSPYKDSAWDTYMTMRKSCNTSGASGAAAAGSQQQQQGGGRSKGNDKCFKCNQTGHW
ncbi:MAG: hypothetical protein WDW38_006328 [Sanguina aurantia]